MTRETYNNDTKNTMTQKNVANITCNGLPPICVGFPHRIEQDPLFYLRFKYTHLYRLSFKHIGIVCRFNHWNRFYPMVLPINFPTQTPPVQHPTHLKQSQAKPFKMGGKFAAQVIGKVSPATQIRLSQL